MVYTEAGNKPPTRPCCRVDNLKCSAQCAGVTPEQYCKLHPEEYPQACKALGKDKKNIGLFNNICKYLIIFYG